nr:ubiquitin hydrolase [Tanacetum cinerariifolium]
LIQRVQRLERELKARTLIHKVDRGRSKPVMAWVPKMATERSTTNKVKTVKKPSVKYAELYQKITKISTVRGNQRNWNNLKSQQLGENLVRKNKACYNCGHFDHLTYNCRLGVKIGRSSPKNNYTHRRESEKGFSGVETPLFKGMLVYQEIEEEGDADEHVEEVTAGDAAHGDDSAAHGEVPTITQEPSIPSPTHLLHHHNHLKISLQHLRYNKHHHNHLRRVEHLEYDKAAPARVAAAPSRRRKGVVIRDPEEQSTTSKIMPAKTKSKDKGKGILVEEPKPLKKKQQIEMDEEYARKLHAELNKDIDCDVAIDHVKLKAKEDPAIKRYQAMKRKPQTEAQA